MHPFKIPSMHPVKKKSKDCKNDHDTPLDYRQGGIYSGDRAEFAPLVAVVRKKKIIFLFCCHSIGE